MDHFGLRESTLCYERIEMGYSACVHSLLNFLESMVFLMNTINDISSGVE